MFYSVILEQTNEDDSMISKKNKKDLEFNLEKHIPKSGSLKIEDVDNAQSSSFIKPKKLSQKNVIVNLLRLDWKNRSGWTFKR